MKEAEHLEFLLGQMVESSILERVGLALTLQDGTLVPTLTKVATDSGDQFIQEALVKLLPQRAQAEQGLQEIVAPSQSDIVLIMLLTWLERAWLDRFNADALLTAQWTYVSAGLYGATAGTHVFGKRVLPTVRSYHFDLASFFKVEIKSGDPYAHLLTGLDAGVETRVYIPLTHVFYVNNGSQPYQGMD
ncbi:major outer sheath C-terminal domain-containing protein, partial [Treponema paraluiscuniculi]|uniref:major outer sheath C-terminal domain-containing protein n=1 Tax=Treponema paraluiscuniculi TaxID=53435 RepID=UPI003A5215C9